MGILEDLHPNNLRYLFYLVTPQESMSFEKYEDVTDYTDRASIWMLILILLEFFFLDERKYAFNDTITSINAGIFSLLMKVGGRYLSAFLYVPFYNMFHIVDLPQDSAWVWLLCFFTQDFMYYCLHRAVHEAGVFWSFHQMHHSSEYYNLSTALRQGAIQDAGTAIFDLCQCVIIPPNIFLVHRYLNLLYQFWLHTEMVPYLGPLEYVFNTPSSHRVHHGRNKYCIDKNYAGTLIIWDRMFGTYVKEKDDEEIAYGLVTNVNTFNQLYCQLFEFKALGWDKGQMRDEKGNEIFPGTMNKIKAAIWPPGWFPGVKTKFYFAWLCMKDPTEGIPEIEYPVVRYDRPLNKALKIYLLLSWIGLVAAALKYNEIRTLLSWSEYFIVFSVFIATFQMFGYYFDNEPFAYKFDLLRLLVISSLAYYRNLDAVLIYGGLSSFTVLALNSFGLINVKKDVEEIKKKD